MKVPSVSSKSSVNMYDAAYMYSAPEKKCKKYVPQYMIATGTVALAAVLITLFNVGSKKSLHKII